MISVFEEVSKAASVRLKDNAIRNIAIVGAGHIVEHAHLPAYTKVGIPVYGIYDIDYSKAVKVAEKFGIKNVFKSLDELLASDHVDVVDFAVVPTEQPSLVKQALKARKHVLCQKPFVMDSSIGEEILNLARTNELKVGVNQQLRYDEGIAVARAMVEKGWIGTVRAVYFYVNIWTDWSMWKWLVDSPRLEIWFHSIHYIDAIRSILGTPKVVFCGANRSFSQAEKGETRVLSTLLYADGAVAAVHSSHLNRTGDAYASFRIEGERGVIKGTLGLLYNYPYGRPDTLEVWSDLLPTDGWLPYPVTTRWIPDAFAGPMISLLNAIMDDGIPYPDASDNLWTVKVVEALYKSMDEGTAVQVHNG